MALSNWDDKAWDVKGNPMPSIIEFGIISVEFGTVSVEVYKNWLYIKDAAAWDENSGYRFPTIMEISEGYIRYKKIIIHAIRGPQNSIMARVECGYDNDAVMYAIGAYGYDDNGDFVGVLPETVAEFRKWLKEDYDIPEFK